MVQELAIYCWPLSSEREVEENVQRNATFLPGERGAEENVQRNATFLPSER